MTHHDIDYLKSKLKMIKTKSEVIHCLNNTCFDKIMETIDRDEFKDSTRTDDINVRLDAVSERLVAQYHQSCRLVTELAAPCVDDPGESMTYVPCSTDETSPLSQHYNGHDVTTLAGRLQALEVAMTALSLSVQENTLHLNSAKAEQDSAIQTVGETLSSSVLCELDSLNANLQQGILNCRDALNRQSWDIQIIKDQVRNVEKTISDVSTWKQIASELTSRLFTLENTTHRFITEQQQYRTKMSAQIKDEVLKMLKNGVPENMKVGMPQMVKDGVSQMVKDGVPEMVKDGVPEIINAGVLEI